MALTDAGLDVQAPLNEWLLILGAGGSAGRPKGLPTFDQLSEGVMRSLGWDLIAPADQDADRRWSRTGIGAFDQPDMTPEVLFGTLTSSRIGFAKEIARVLSHGSPNVAHHVAAAVLQAGGLVWTTNVDCGIEQACPTMPPRAGRASTGTKRPLRPILTAAQGALVKFHGTVERRGTLAFTDRELLEPLGSREVEHLVELVRARTVVLYGYAGADADLFEVLEAAFAAASRVIWFEPTAKQQRAIADAFPETEMTVRPKPPDREMRDFAGTASMFAEFAQHCGATLSTELVREFITSPTPPVPSLRDKHPPALAHAHLIERFGDGGCDVPALRAARNIDLRRHLRLTTLPGYARWEISLSLYGATGRPAGRVRKLHEWLAEHRRVLAHVQPARLRNQLITRVCAVLLQDKRPQRLEEFADWAVQCRTGRQRASDLYYRAQGRRYGLRIAEAVADANAARAGLSAGRDPERHAGAVLEQGLLAIYQGRFRDAQRCAFELRQRTGRYAIPRWRAWGAFLEAIATCYLHDPDEPWAEQAREALGYAGRRFTAEQRPGPIADVRTAELLVARVELAAGIATVDYDRSTTDAEQLKRRYLDDRLLVLADLALGEGDKETARKLIAQVRADPSCPVAAAWARIGEAELLREDDAEAAADRFRAVAGDAERLGAWWLQAQAQIGVRICKQPDNMRPPEHLREEIARESFADRHRVLWMMTT